MSTTTTTSEGVVRRRIVISLVLLTGTSATTACSPFWAASAEQAAGRAGSPTPVPEAAEDPLAVYGTRLGAVREFWLAAAGTPAREASGGDRFPNGALVGWKTAGGKARAHIVGVSVPRPVADPEIRRAIRPFHPADAKPVRSYTATAARVEVFQSDALARVFASLLHTTPGDPGPFGNNPPGTFCEFVTGAGLTTATHAALVLGTVF